MVLVIFFGNEFFDAIPIKQFKNEKGFYLKNIILLIKIKKLKKFLKKLQKKMLQL